MSTNRSNSPKPPIEGRTTTTTLSGTSTAAIDLGENTGFVTFIVPSGGAHLVFGLSDVGAAVTTTEPMPAGMHSFDIGPTCRYFRAIQASGGGTKLEHWVG